MAQLFLSYSRRDRNFVESLIPQLNTAGHEVWLDQREIGGGETWRTQIVEAIERSQVVLIVLSQNSIASKHVLKELDLAEEGKVPIIPVAIEPVDIPSSMKFHLSGLQIINTAIDLNASGAIRSSTLRGEAAAQSKPPLSAAQSKTLTSLGWELNSANHYHDWEARTDSDRISVSQHIMRTFVEVYGVRGDVRIEVEHQLDWVAPGRAILVPQEAPGAGQASKSARDFQFLLLRGGS